MRTGGRVSQGEAAQPVSATKVRRRRAARRRNDDGSAEILVDHAGAEELIAEDAVNGQAALRDGVGDGRKRRGKLHRAHRVVVQQLHARGAPPLDELELAALGDAELDGQLSSNAAARRLVGVDPLALDPLANLIEVVLVARVRRVERNRLRLRGGTCPPSATGRTVRRRRAVGSAHPRAAWARQVGASASPSATDREPAALPAASWERAPAPRTWVERAAPWRPPSTHPEPSVRRAVREQVRVAPPRRAVPAARVAQVAWVPRRARAAPARSAPQDAKDRRAARSRWDGSARCPRGAARRAC